MNVQHRTHNIECLMEKVKKQLLNVRFPVNGCAARIGNRYRDIGKKTQPINAKRNELRYRTTLPGNPFGVVM